MASARSEIETQGDYEEIYAKVRESVAAVGKIKQESKQNGQIFMKTRMKLFPSPIKGVSLGITVKQINHETCSIRFNAQCYYGVIGLGSPNRVMEKVYEELFRRIG